MKPRIRRLVEGVHMGLGHRGLHDLLLKQCKINVETLEPGDLVLCLNAKGDKLKAIGCKGMVIGYLKMPHGRRIMKDALQYIPQTFGGAGFDYDAATRKALEVRLGSYHPRKPSPFEVAEAKAKAGL